jgi:hypothetical protein
MYEKLIHAVHASKSFGLDIDFVWSFSYLSFNDILHLTFLVDLEIFHAEIIVPWVLSFLV